ncbi:MAG TPA: calcium/sodium antiporter, partial [Fimbriimonadaceae bacterium]|nr:calcium/sodium antiporter [Fimbriimonadaceae bacterium]
WLVDGASAIASRLGVSSLFIGLTVVAFGTSLPEFFVNITSAVQGSDGVAFGNVVGSNLANTLLILGIVTVLHPPKLAHSTIWKEIPFSVLAALALFVLSNDFLFDGADTIHLTRTDGLVLLLFMAIFLYYLVGMALADRSIVQEPPEGSLSPTKALGLCLLGVVMLYFGGTWTVEGATGIARAFGMSEFMIAATIVAFGTSLPELLTSIKAARKKSTDIAVGNIIGSNIFNVFWVLGLTAVILPLRLPEGINADLGVLILASLFLFMFLFVGTKHELKRWQGWMFLSGYAGYITFLIVRG